MASSATSTASLEEATEVNTSLRIVMTSLAAKPAALAEAAQAQRAGYGTCEEGGKAAREAAEEELCRTAVWGLYCQYAAVGVVYGFSSTYLTLPICQYVFGPMGAPGRTSVQQCNICSTLSLLPWNLKVFYGIFLDRVGFFGTRRKGWILFGWATAMALLVVLASFAEHLVYHGQFATYVMLWMAVCAFYMIADVASDGMTVELSKLEPEETRGHILTTGQMVRFAMTLATSVLGTLTMNGESYYPARGGSDGTVFSFELSFGQVHIALLLMCVPFFSGMV